MAVPGDCSQLFSPFSLLHFFEDEHGATMELLMNQRSNLFSHRIIMYLVVFQLAKQALTFEPERLFLCFFFLISVPLFLLQNLQEH